MVTIVADLIRERCKRVGPDSMLLRRLSELVNSLRGKELRQARRWSLYNESSDGDYSGFVTASKGCFAGQQLRSVEYEDLIERTIYRFKRVNATAYYGQKGLSKVSKHRVGDNGACQKACGDIAAKGMIPEAEGGPGRVF